MGPKGEPYAEVVKEIEDELRRRPDLSIGVLYQFAIHLEPRLGELDLRAFNARYVLPAKQRLTAEAQAAWRRRRRERRAARPKRGAQSPRGGAKRGRAAHAGRPPAHPIQPGGLEPAAAAIQQPEVVTAPDEDLTPVISAARTIEAEETQTAEEYGQPMEILRARIRSALMEFAGALAHADGRADFVRTVTDVDRYVDRALTVQGNP